MKSLPSPNDSSSLAPEEPPIAMTCFEGLTMHAPTYMYIIH